MIIATKASEDPRLDTFWKRLNYFRRPREEDSVFAARVGITTSTLRRWKKRPPVNGRSDLLNELARRLDVDTEWLTSGTLHCVRILHKEMVGLTYIPRFQGFYTIVDDIGDFQLRIKKED